MWHTNGGKHENAWEGRVKENVLEDWGNNREPIVIFLVGGGAMCFREQKNATKDLDVVFANFKDYSEFLKAMKRMGFRELLKLEREYERMQAASVWQNQDGFRF
ncbi:MAG: hypothetical protein QXF56_04605 [Candidatus Micrarchaeia archaeon]